MPRYIVQASICNCEEKRVKYEFYIEIDSVCNKSLGNQSIVTGCDYVRMVSVIHVLNYTIGRVYSIICVCICVHYLIILNGHDIDVSIILDLLLIQKMLL